MPIRYLGLYPVNMLIKSLGKDNPKWRMMLWFGLVSKTP